MTGGASLAVNLVGAAAWVAAASPPPPGRTIEFSGETPQAVIAAMSDAIGIVTRDIHSQRDRIDRCLSDARSTLAVDSKNFVFPRPALADAPPSTLTGPTGLGYVP